VGMESDGSDRAPDSTPTPSGAVHVSRRALVSYPEKLQESLRAVYGNRINITNWGYSGDNIQMGYEKFNKKGNGVTADFAIVNSGINDAIGTWNTWYNDVDKYIAYFEKVILNHTLCNRAVFILTPFKQQKSDYLTIKSFVNALTVLAEKYNLPIIDGHNLMKNQSVTIYSGTDHSDDKHFNSIGYTIAGARISSKFFGEAKKVGSGDTLLTRQTVDSVRYINGCSFGSTAGANTPSELIINEGIYCYMVAGAKLIYSFETLKENLVVCPLFYISGAGEVTITLDFGSQKAQYSYSSGITYPNVPSYTTQADSRLADKYKTGELKGISIPTTGLHSILIETTGVCFFQGLMFLDLADVTSGNTIPFLYGETSSAWSTTSIPSTVVSMTSVNSLGYFTDATLKYRQTLLKLTLYNYNKNVREYILDLPYQSSYLLKETPLNPVPDSLADRSLSGITLSDTELTLNWGGVLDVPSSFTIKVL
jgi:hypothetical protein